KPLTKKNSIDELISFYPQERPSTSRSRNASFNRLRSSSTIWASSLLFFGRRTLSRLRCNGSGTTPEVEYDDAALHPKRRAGCSDLVCLLPELHSRSARHPWREHCSSRRLRAECRRNRSQVRSYTIDFYLSMRCATVGCNFGSFEFMNGRASSISLEENTTTEKLWRIQASLYENMICTSTPSIHMHCLFRLRTNR